MKDSSDSECGGKRSFHARRKVGGDCQAEAHTADCANAWIVKKLRREGKPIYGAPSVGAGAWGIGQSKFPLECNARPRVGAADARAARRCGDDDADFIVSPRFESW